MANQPILDYISEQRKLNVPDNAIKVELLKTGWAVELVNEAFAQSSAAPQLTNPTPPPPTPISEPATPSPDLISQTTTAPPAQALTSQHTKRFKTITVLGLILLAILLSGGVGAYAFYQSRPEVVIQKMFAASPNIKTLTYQGNASIHANLENYSPSEPGMGAALLAPKTESVTTVNFTSSADITDPEHPKGTANVMLTTDALSESMESIEVETRVLDAMYYMLFKQLPSEFLAMFGPQILNQWIQIDTKEMLENQGSEMEQTLSTEDTEKIAKILEKSHVFVITEKLASEKIDDTNTYHYAFSLDEAELKRTLLEIYPIINKKSDEQDQTYFAEDLDEMFKSVEFKNAEIWIGTKDYFARKLQFQVSASDPDSNRSIGYVDFTIEMKDYNEPVVIEEPESAKTLEEIMDNMYSGDSSSYDPGSFSGSQNDAYLRGKDTGMRSDAAQLLDAFDRFNAFNGYSPWLASEGQARPTSFIKINAESPWMDISGACPVLEKLSDRSTPNCRGYGELKNSFIDRISNPQSDSLYVYNDGGTNTYICFEPRSQHFIEQVQTSCKDSSGSGLPVEIPPGIKVEVCAGLNNPNGKILSCLP